MLILYEQIEKEEIEEWKRLGAQIDKRRSESGLPILPKRYLITMAKIHHQLNHFGHTGLAKTILKGLVCLRNLCCSKTSD